MRTWIIYKHTLLISENAGKAYIGQTCTSTKDRWHNGKGYRNCTIFWRAIKKYGWDNFSHEILEDGINSRELANEREIFWISFFNTYLGNANCNGYNMTRGGSYWGRCGKFKIYKPETNEKMFIYESDLADYEKLGWKRWYTEDRKATERHKYYLAHKEKENAQSLANWRKNFVPKPKKKPMFDIKLKKEDFASVDEYKKAYQKEYNKLYKKAKAQYFKEYFSKYQKEHRDEVNKNSRKRYEKQRNIKKDDSDKRN